jgi:hypothetical protein
MNKLKYCYFNQLNAESEAKFITSNIRGEACHRLAVNSVSVAAVIHPGGVHVIGKVYLYSVQRTLKFRRKEDYFRRSITLPSS